MSARFDTGLVVGKFSPLHRGHLGLIQFAAAKCKRLVIVSYSSPEYPGCAAEQRERWLRACAPESVISVITPEKVTQLQQAGMAVPDMPANDASDNAQRQFMAAWLQRVLEVNVQAVFTSEAYGEGFAAALSAHFGEQVMHVSYDPQRSRMPVSGTQLRQHWRTARQHLALPVLDDWMPRLCLLGAESTGKSTLTAWLAAWLDEPCVAEYGRELWEQRQGKLIYDDLLMIAEEQVRREQEAACRARHWVICDTSPLTTLFYSLALFAQAAPALHHLSQRAYHKVFLSAPDFPMVQDGTRQDEAFRLRQHQWYVDTLNQRGIPYQLLSGPLEERQASLKVALLSG
ncbi:AAA family ATPase [Leeia aquatica]|uniref:AAA family ATPase n=1 Tax=Leeia aquatica TaxID=2725557 RepID=A0A847S904_9NEIS|nr:AAA family ATPase [Leeia aquatica]NLR76474.1 AAA family ATPase [Leeia aquatica]